MTFFTDAGERAGEPITLVPSGTRTTNGSGPSAPTGPAHTARLTLRVTAAGGTTPSMTITLETSDDGAAWAAVGTFPAVTGTGNTRRVFSGLDRLIRASWAITGGGGQTFTFSIDGGLVGS